MTSTEGPESFWLNRFQVNRGPGGKLRFRDWLVPPERELKAEKFAGLAGRDLAIAFFQRGFMRPALSAVGAAVGDGPRNLNDKLFWQFPCRTEAAAWDQHACQPEPALVDGVMHIYLGLPWATWIDVERKNKWGSDGAASMHLQLQLNSVRVSGLRHALAKLGVPLRVHTVCQHIYWKDMAPAWRKLGMSDVWLSHCPQDQAEGAALGFRIHPWSLYAVNVLDPQRRAGLTEARDPATKALLASFVGANCPHYITDIRLRLPRLSTEPRFVVRVTDKWHFEDVVYSHQIANESLPQSQLIDDSVAAYNRLLSDSVFSLCPAGAGPNTLRLWESLAVGAIPVLLGPAPAMPRGGNLPVIDWENCMLRIADEQLEDLPRILSAIPIDRVREMQRLGMEAHALVRHQCCF
jgi:hypothetical protein